MPRAAIVSNTLSRFDGRLIKVSEVLEDMGFEVSLVGFQALGENMPGAMFPVTLPRQGFLPERIANTVYYRGQKRAILKKLFRLNPDLFICADVIALEICAAAKAKTGSRLIYDAHEYFRDEFPGEGERRNWVERIETTHASAVDDFITVNGSLAKLYAGDEAGFPVPVVVRNAAKRRRPFEYDGRLHEAAGITRDTKILLYHGGITPLRGIALLCEAAPLLTDDWVVVLMGTAAPPAWVPAPHSKLKFVPAVAQHELHKWICGASLGAVLYEDGALNQKFCSPNKIWEYPASGVPILASNLPEIARVVQSYNCGIIIPDDERTADHLAQRVSSLSAAEMQAYAAGCARASAKENWEIEAEKLRTIFRRVEII